ncbi:hypothetical protein [Flavihumibacter fluvii]|uniref:hypothetical protein n=1 Tax=Flavihumibacter fluvii TaxID=2838157 RepID=UPI001BDEB3DB|nr:hypothetical protein [Flavihumibacter fluvii]ULQ51573.1 hypothetical protein KJS93_15900 [Flavihumibacter fluvii]
MYVPKRIIGCLFGLFFLTQCQKKKDTIPTPVKLGVTPWPAEYSLASVASAYDFINRECDFVMQQIDEGIPYEEAFNKEPMPKALSEDIGFRKLYTGTKPVFLSVSALSLTRKSKTSYYRLANETPPDKKQYWESLPFDHPDVITAYVNYVEYLAGQFSPQWINFGVESNLDTWDPAEFARYKAFCAGVYAALKISHPGIPVFLSLVVNEEERSMHYARQLLPYSDWVALSAYPYTHVSSSANGNTDPDRFPEGYFERWLDLAPAKPWCFAETGYIAENLDVPEYSLHKEGTQLWQNRYLQKLGELMRARNGQFAVWFCYTDYDALIPTLEASGDYQPLFLFWRDTGLYDENNQPRPVLQTWRDLRQKN